MKFIPPPQIMVNKGGQRVFVPNRGVPTIGASLFWAHLGFRRLVSRAAQRRSMPTLLTLAFQTCVPFSHAGALAGFGTCFLSPLNTCTLSVPRSRNLMLVCPLLAAFRAAWRGCLLWYTVLVSFPFSISTKYFFSLIEFHLRLSCFHSRL
jgi:hypothetical protein